MMKLVYTAVVPKLVQTVTQMKVAIISCYPPIKNFRISCQTTSAVITHNTEHQCCLVLRYPRRIAY